MNEDTKRPHSAIWLTRGRTPGIIKSWIRSASPEDPGPSLEENVNAEQAGQSAIEYLKKMGFSFVQVLVSSPESTGTGQIWRIEADVGYTRKRIARIWIDPGTGEVIKHEVEA